MSALATTPRARALAPALELLAALLAGLAALLVLREASLATPYWWDAGAVYAPGAKWLADHGLAQGVPGRFPSDLSRGHTPGFYLLTALVYRAFGASPSSGHALVLGFGALTLALTYALGARLFDRVTGALAAAGLACAPLFLTMSSELLPELPITALSVAALLALAHERYLLCAALGTALVLFKETGVATPVAVGCALLYRGRREGSLARGFALACRAALAPGLVLAAFFLWQKRAEGWFVLPYHAALFEEGHSLAEQGLWVLRTMLFDDGRAPLTLTALALGVYARLARPARSWLAPAAPERALARDTALVAIALVAAFNQVFFTKMFFLERYALPAHPGLLVALCAALTHAARSGPRLVRVCAVAALAGSLAWGLALRHAPGGYASGETSFRYLDAIAAQRQVFAQLDARPRPPVLLAPWPLTDALRYPWLGYVAREHRVVSQYWYEDPSADHREDPAIEAVVTQVGLGGHARLVQTAERLGFVRTERAQVGGAVVELYERR